MIVTCRWCLLLMLSGGVDTQQGVVSERSGHCCDSVVVRLKTRQHRLRDDKVASHASHPPNALYLARCLDTSSKNSSNEAANGLACRLPSKLLLYLYNCQQEKLVVTPYWSSTDEGLQTSCCTLQAGVGSMGYPLSYRFLNRSCLGSLLKCIPEEHSSHCHFALAKVIESVPSCTPATPRLNLLCCCHSLVMLFAMNTYARR